MNMTEQQCKPLGWVLRHSKTKLWYTGSSGSGPRRQQNWTDNQLAAKKYAAANHAYAAAQRIEEIPGVVTDTYLLLHTGVFVVHIKFSRERQALIENPFIHPIKNPFKTLDNPVNK